MQPYLFAQASPYNLSKCRLSGVERPRMDDLASMGNVPILIKIALKIDFYGVLKLPNIVEFEIKLRYN